jgi:cell division septum initiation protein DivIVA
MSSQQLPPQGRPPATAADAAKRLATIVDAAERAAASVIDDAERQAQEQIEEARSRADRMVAERLRELADEIDPPEAGSPTRSPHLRPVEDHGEQRRSTSAGARLLATQMAVSGASREEIEARLRSGFEIEDTAEILDAILGPEG